MSIELYHRQILYDVQWQMLRMQCLGYWATHGGVEMNISDLKEYLRAGLHEIAPPEGARRVWRVLNLLNAVLLGGIVGDREAVIKLRDRCSDRKQLTSFQASWDWSVVVQDLQSPVWSNRSLRELKKNLSKRIYIAKRRGHSATETRPELMRFLNFLEAEIGRRKG